MTRKCLGYGAGAALGAAMITLAAIGPATTDRNEIDAAALSALIERHPTVQADKFRDFAELIRRDARNASFAPSLGKFLAGEVLDETSWISVSRLHGLYVRLRHRDALMRTLTDLVAIPTDKKGDEPQHLNPEVRRFGRLIRRLADRFGLEFRDVDNRIFEVTLPGTGGESIGVFTHGDVVPADPAKWVLPGGRRLEPYKLTVIGDRIYGRGTSDDKSEIAAALFAMAAIKRAGFKLRRTIRLLIETTEETGGEATEYYKKRHALAPYNIVLDGKYPVRTGVGAGAEIGAEIVTPDPAALKQVPDGAAHRYVAANGGDFRIDMVVAPDRLNVVVIGRSTHSASPQNGVNPVSRLFDFLHAARKAAPFKSNHFTDAAAYAAANWGIDYLGAKLDIGYSDPFMGPLTAAVTQVQIKDGALWLAVNPRAPRGKEPDRLISEIRGGLDAWRRRTGTDVTFDITLQRYMYRNPAGPWISTLLDIFADVTGVAAKPASSSGYTTAHQLPNGVQFGLGMPGEAGTAHRANEYKKLSNYLRDAQIVTEMMMRLSNLERME